jgi:magnesium-transporting ATPase (P-type)
VDENVKWKDLRIGDVVYLRKDDLAPADIILLDTG